MSRETGAERAAAARVVGRIADAIEGELEDVVARVVVRIREEIPDFRRLPRDTLGAPSAAT